MDIEPTYTEIDTTPVSCNNNGLWIVVAIAIIAMVVLIAVILIIVFYNNPQNQSQNHYDITVSVTDTSLLPPLLLQTWSGLLACGSTFSGFNVAQYGFDARTIHCPTEKGLIQGTGNYSKYTLTWTCGACTNAQ